MNLRNAATFGVAGNFTGHLEQAGEAFDFVNIKTAEAKAPKAVFPTYIPETAAEVPEFLNVYPFDCEKIVYPENEQKVQIEPECALLVKAEWEGSKIKALSPLSFTASNDCSIRKEGAKKISLKKNWGTSSKGLSDRFIPITHFNEKGNINIYRIASFIKRNGETFVYGEDSAVRDYSYIYDQLITWLVDKFNNQADEGPAENINLYLNKGGKPDSFIVSIGATRYTDFGEHNFLQNGDKTYVILYPENKFTPEQIIEKVKNDDLDDAEISPLIQEVVLK